MADKEYSLIEEIDSKACDTLLNRVDGEECFNIMFPPSDDDFKSELDKRNGCWTVTKKYLLKMRDNGSRCDMQYNHVQTNETYVCVCVRIHICIYIYIHIDIDADI